MSFLIFILLTLSSSTVHSTPVDDSQLLRDFYQQQLPLIAFSDYADGVYAFDADSKAAWLDINQFPPYEFSLEKGKNLFKQPFANKSHYADCFPNNGIAIAQLYPYWDEEKQSIITLASAINDCRLKNRLPTLTYESDEITYLMAYMADTSRGQLINTHMPNSALPAYERGKAYFYQRRGQLNFSCASCHVDNAGKFIRSEILSPALGHTTHWPAYRLKTGKLGSLHTRFKVCNRLIRAKVHEAQSTELRELEFYLSYLSNGLPLNGPSIRK